jgi:Ca2+-binding EF-hand superfamily protein
MRQDIYNLLSEEFKAMDRNNDGSLEEDEFLGYLENMHLKYQ